MFDITGVNRFSPFSLNSIKITTKIVPQDNITYTFVLENLSSVLQFKPKLSLDPKYFMNLRCSRGLSFLAAFRLQL